MKFSYLAVLAFASTVLGQTMYHSGLDEKKCIDVYNNEQTPGTNVTIFDCNGTAAQEWVTNPTGPAIHLFDNQSLCLDGGHSPAPGMAVTIETCDSNSTSQRFSPTPFGNLIELISTGLCINVPNHNTTNWNTLELELCNATDEGQVWHPSQQA